MHSCRFPSSHGFMSSPSLVHQQFPVDENFDYRTPKCEWKAMLVLYTGNLFKNNEKSTVRFLWYVWDSKEMLQIFSHCICYVYIYIPYIYIHIYLPNQNLRVTSRIVVVFFEPTSAPKGCIGVHHFQDSIQLRFPSYQLFSSPINITKNRVISMQKALKGDV